MTADEGMTMAGRWKQLLFWGVFSIAAAGAFGSGIYAYLHKDAFPSRDDTAGAPSAAAPTQVGRMALKAQFVGPLKDTVVQRWEDPATGNTCYIYLPVVVQHSPPTPTGFVQYGANGIGSISCLH
jgi:hypothetical protein